MRLFCNKINLILLPLIFCLCSNARSIEERIRELDLPKRGKQLIRLGDLKKGRLFDDSWRRDIPITLDEFSRDEAGEVKLIELLKYHADSMPSSGSYGFTPNRVVMTSPLVVEHRFIAVNPSIKPTAQKYVASCDEVQIAYKKNRILHDQFKQLRKRASELIEPGTASEGEMEKLIQEIAAIRKQLVAVYPPKFFAIDRKGTYRFLNHNDNPYKDDFFYAQKIPYGTSQVLLVKLGSDDWIPLHLGLLGFADFLDDPNFDSFTALTAVIPPKIKCLQK